MSNDEEGVIEEFIGADMANILVNGKNYHAFLSDLEHPYLRWFLKNGKKNTLSKPYIDQVHTDKKFKRQQVLADGVYLVFMPVYKQDFFDEVVEKIKVYVYNETQQQYNLEYNCLLKTDSLFALDSELLPRSEFYVHDINFETMASSPQFHYHFVDKQNAALDLTSSLILKPKKLFEKLDEIKYANHALFHFKLFEELFPKAKEEVYIPYSTIDLKKKVAEEDRHFNFAKALKKSKYEIDLHIEKLLPNYKGLSASEIKQIQLKECQHALDLAIATHQQSLIIIHGVGKGALKHEINILLNQTKYIKKYVNEYDVRYGYGATEVHFQY